MKTPISRRIFFWILVLTYFATTGLTLFYVFGYRHDFAQKIFVHTGSLTVKVNPRDINILIDNKHTPKRLINIINDSYFITGLRPGEHSLTITRDEFKPWHKNFAIHSGFSTEFWNIILIRQNYNRIQFDISDVDKFFPAPLENLYATTRQMGKTLTIYIFDIKRNTTKNTFIFPHATFTHNKHENIEWSPESTDIIIPITKDSLKDYAIANITDSSTFLLSEYTDLPNIRAVRWSSEEKNNIYFISQKDLFTAEIDAQQETLTPVLIKQNVSAYDFADDGLYVLDTDYNVLYSRDKKDPNFKILTKLEIDNDDFANKRLIAYDNQRTVTLDDTTQKLYLYNKGEKNIYTTKLGDNIIGSHFSDDGKKLLFYSPYEIFVYFTRDWTAQPIRKENETQSIIRFSYPLDNVQFSKDYEHIIFTTNGEIKITELDYRGSRITDTITTLKEKDTTLVDKHKMNRLFFIDSSDTKTRQLQSIKFPERKTFFKNTN